MSTRPALWPSQHTKADPRQKAKWTKPDLRLVEGGNAPRQARLSPRKRLIALTSLVGVVLFGVVAFHVVLSQGAFKLENMTIKANEQQDQYERNRLLVAQLESPQRITSEAQNRLNMVAPAKITPVSPNQNDMPRGTSPGSDLNAATPNDATAGDWSDIKSQLNSSAQ